MKEKYILIAFLLTFLLPLTSAVYVVDIGNKSTIIDTGNIINNYSIYNCTGTDCMRNNTAGWNNSFYRVIVDYLKVNTQFLLGGTSWQIGSLGTSPGFYYSGLGSLVGWADTSGNWNVLNNLIAQGHTGSTALDCPYSTCVNNCQGNTYCTGTSGYNCWNWNSDEPGCLAQGSYCSWDGVSMCLDVSCSNFDNDQAGCVTLSCSFNDPSSYTTKTSCLGAGFGWTWGCSGQFSQSYNIVGGIIELC